MSSRWAIRLDRVLRNSLYLKKYLDPVFRFQIEPATRFVNTYITHVISVDKSKYCFTADINHRRQRGGPRWPTPQLFYFLRRRIECKIWFALPKAIACLCAQLRLSPIGIAVSLRRIASFLLRVSCLSAFKSALPVVVCFAYGPRRIACSLNMLFGRRGAPKASVCCFCGKAMEQFNYCWLSPTG